MKVSTQSHAALLKCNLQKDYAMKTKYSTQLCWNDLLLQFNLKNKIVIDKVMELKVSPR